ncbi:MAG: hypothetical protein AAF688_13290 [Bacteroidota bacterium]
MGLFDSLNETTDKATDIGEEYINTSREYFKLKLFKQLATTVSFISKYIIYAMLTMLVLIFISVSAALAIGRAIGSQAYGFLIVGGLLLVLLIIAILLSKKIDDSIVKKLSKKFF